MGIDASAVARVVGTDVSFKDLRGGATLLLPQRVAVVGQGSTLSTYSLDPATLVSAAAVGAAYGFGSPLHLAALQLLPANGDGLGTVPMTVYPMDDDGAGVVATADITPTGTQVGAASYVVKIAGVSSAPFTIADAELGTDLEARITAAINATLAMPMIAVAGTDVIDLTSKWKGSSANDLVISVEGPSNGITFAFTQPNGGLVNPDVAVPLAKIVAVWETIVVNCMEHDDTTSLNSYQTAGELRWDKLVKKPYFVLTGATTTTTALAVITNARKTDRINGYACAFGSANIACQIAARAAARIAVIGNGNPPKDYGGQSLTGLVAGADSLQETYTALDAAVKDGVSTSNIVDGIVSMLDTVTFYHPDGEEPPAYRYVVDLIKLQNIIFNISVIFEADDWNGAPLIPDDQPTTNPTARKPKDAAAAVNTMIDGLALQAILSDPETAKDATTAVINSGNPKRLDVGITVQLSGNTNIISTDLMFGFYFGTLPII